MWVDGILNLFRAPQRQGFPPAASNMPSEQGMLKNRIVYYDLSQNYCITAPYSWTLHFGGSFFYLQLEFFCLQLSFFAYSLLRPLLDALSHCKQKSSNCKQKELKL